MLPYARPSFARAFIYFLSAFIALAPQFAVSASAQTQSGVAVTGTIQDPSGAPVAMARVTFARGAAAAAVSTSTDEQGTFQLMLLPGEYTAQVAAGGFADVTRRFLAAGPAPRLDVTLQLAQVREDVTVSAPAGYDVPAIRSATKTPTLLRDVPQSVTVVTQSLIQDQLMLSMGDVMRYVPGVAVHQGENNRDQIIMRGNSTSADFFVDGVRDDVQYYRDLYNVSRVEVLKGPNALMFGRGGAGGVVNRVEKEALFQPIYQASLEGGSYGNTRFTADIDEPIGSHLAFRLNGMLEDSDSFRSNVGLKRHGVTPTLTFTPRSSTKIVASYEYLNDTRVADRGITSFGGKPVDVDPSTYYGNPADSHVDANVNLGFISVEQKAGRFNIRNHTSIANYDRRYQNYVPGAVSADQTQVTLTAYNNATDRTNVFNQTDVTFASLTGRLRHTVLLGAEIGHQTTDNFRNTGFFNNTSTSIQIPFGATTITTPTTFRQGATDANNHVGTSLAAGYAQDQIELSSHVQLVGGLRFDRFDLQYHDNRAGTDLGRTDNFVSPRAGLIYKPIAPVSVYTSYSKSYLPGSGDQFSSLTSITQQLEPERLNNYEVGAKWDAAPGVAITTAAYRLDRTNTRSTDPNDPTRIIQTGSQRTNGLEAGANGTITRAWAIAGGYAYQNAYVAAATASAKAGAQVGQVPHHTLSLWNNYRIHPRVAAAVGVVYRSDMFVAVDDAVTLPGYTRADAALFVTLSSRTRLQFNLENVFNHRYFTNADSNTNISPGSPRALRVGLTTTF